MDKPKFTQGPWKVDTTEDELWGDDVWYRVEYHSVWANDEKIAGDVSSKENAVLIAAAPEMYELLQSLVNSPDLAEWWQINRRKMQKVLEKARGEK